MIDLSKTTFIGPEASDDADRFKGFSPRLRVETLVTPKG